MTLALAAIKLQPAIAGNGQCHHGTTLGRRDLWLSPVHGVATRHHQNPFQRQGLLHIQGCPGMAEMHWIEHASEHTKPARGGSAMGCFH